MNHITLLDDVVDINPHTTLKKGTNVAFISMDKIDPFTRKIKVIDHRKYNGGQKYKNGDTLFARITPCLENGKTAFVDFLDKGEVGAGSTEFVILRAKQGITDPDYVYYLAISSEFRKYAIQSMIGTSGRQRVQNDALAKYQLTLPKLDVQLRIGNLLRTIDEKIELNRKINETLQQMGLALFKHYFINNPEIRTWPTKKLGEFLEVLESGSRPKGGAIATGIPSIGAENIEGLGIYDYSKEKYISKIYANNLSRGRIESEDVLLYKDGAYVGKKSMFMDDFPHKICFINEHVFRLRTNQKLPSQPYLYFWLDQESITKMIIDSGIKAAQPGINQENVKNLPILIPPIKLVGNFNHKVQPIFKNIFLNANQMRDLVLIRDTLLPKLIFGKIKI